MANEFIKKPHKKDSYSEEQLMIMVRCENDPEYFIEKFVKVQHPVKGAIPLILYPFQRKLLRAFHNHRNSIALTGRQMGKTTVAAAYLLWKAMFIEDFKILIVANKLRSALEVMSRVKYAYEECPDWIKAGVTKFNEGTVAFDNGSLIEAVATTPDAARGKALSLLYADEFAFVPNNMATAFWTAVQPTLSTGGACIITSTPRTDEDQFAQIWKGAQVTTDEYGNDMETDVGVNGFHPIAVPWWEHPERDEEWASPYRASLGAARFAQEYECVSKSTEVIIFDGTVSKPTSVEALYGLLKMSNASV